MNSTIDLFNYYLTDIWNEKGDPRILDYLFMNGGPWPMLILISLYLYIVKIKGPEIMKKREAYNLRKIMLIYNFSLVLISVWLFYKALTTSNYGLYFFQCKLVDQQSTNEDDLLRIKLGWFYFLTKLIELLDTIFFLLRKKFTHISRLHLVHHSIVPISVWFGVKFAPGGLNGLFPFLNTFVHIVMYSYYGLTAIGPSMSFILKYKKLLTLLQITQFVIMLTHGIYFFIISDCPFPPVHRLINLFNAVLFLSFFLSFYRSSYKNAKFNANKINCSYDNDCNNNKQQLTNGNNNNNINKFTNNHNGIKNNNNNNNKKEI